MAGGVPCTQHPARSVHMPSLERLATLFERRSSIVLVMCYAATLRLCPDHLWYEGEVNEGYQRHGRGTLFSESGVAVAKGTWHEDKLHGNGQFACTRGRVYRGNLVNGLPHGLGQLRYPNGDMFEGEFANGKKIGRGIKWNAAGVVIECGTYSAGFLKRQKMTTGPVPRSMLPYGQRLSALGQCARAPHTCQRKRRVVVR